MEISEIKNLSGLLRDHIGKDKNIVDTKITNLTAPGENFGSEMLRLEITITNEQGSTEVLNAVAKRIPLLEILQKVFNIQITFRNEILFYKDIVPILQDFQREKGVKEVIDCFPNFYGGRINLNNSDQVDTDAIFVLENLVVSGYANLDRHVGYDLASAKLTLKDLAALHAVPLAIKLLKPDVFKNKIRPLCVNGVIPFENNNGSKDVTDNNLLIDLMWDSPKCVPLLAKVKKNLRTWVPEREYVPREPFATFSHCDLWVNNAMIKFENGKPIKNKFVDFQVYNYKSPVTDLLFFLFTSVQQSVLEESLDDLIKFYHDSLIQNLKQLGCKLQPFNFSKFQEEIKTDSKRMFPYISIFIMFIVFGPKGVGPTEPPDLTDPNIREKAKQNLHPIAKEKMWYTVQEFNKRDWL